jgi:hypothetical protein
MDKMAAKIKNIVPHWPEFEELIVVGKQIGLSSKSREESVDGKTDKTADEAEDLKAKSILFDQSQLRQSSKSKQQKRLCLKVNGIVLDPESCEEEGTRKLRLIFEYDVTTSEVSVDYLVFENVGLATMRISWQKLEKFRLFRNYTDEQWDKHGFYFDKNELIVLPGHRTEVPVWFKTENCGHFSESWELTTAPKMWSDRFQVVLILESYSFFQRYERESRLNFEIYRC